MDGLKQINGWYSVLHGRIFLITAINTLPVAVPKEKVERVDSMVDHRLLCVLFRLVVPDHLECAIVGPLALGFESKLIELSISFHFSVCLRAFKIAEVLCSHAEVPVRLPLELVVCVWARDVRYVRYVRRHVLLN